jgi:hypothetical protein
MGSVFSEKRMLAWARDLYSFGFKRPGTAEGRRAEDYLLGLMTGFGFPVVRAEDVPFTGWFHDRAAVTVSGPGGSLSFPAEPIVYTAFTGDEGLTAPIVDVGHGTADDFKGKDLAGKIALVTYNHGWLNYDDIGALAAYLHDPDNTLAGRGQVMSWLTEEEMRVYNETVSAGAAGLISVFPFDLTPYLCYEGGEAFSGLVGSIPGIGLRKSDGERLKSILEKGETEATLILTGQTRSAVTRNIVGIIPGQSERVIQITSHHDTMWLGATEDASGVAVVLALAEALTERYRNEKPAHTLAFVLEGAECLFVLGSRGYIGRHKDGMIKNLIVDLHIEHLALEYDAEPDGRLVPTGRTQPRAMFVTNTGPLMEIAKSAVEKFDLRRTIIMPTDTIIGVPTDATAYNRSGLPVISFISPPLYWNTLEDTWEKIAVREMVPTAKAYAYMVDRLLDTDPDSIRLPGPPGDGYIHYRQRVTS